MKKGFSLVELSIVLVILGLLVGGILAGQSLIRAAELRAVTSEFQRYTVAVNAFRDKYFAIPGDMANAQSIWGQSTACSGASTTGTCNGNGDGTVSFGGAGAGLTSESFQFWRQLAAAGLIEGSYSGVSGSVNGGDYVPGTNSPTSKLSGGGWGAWSVAYYAGDSFTYGMNYGNGFGFGGRVSGAWPSLKILKPEEAWNIDTKTDDGKPAYGKVIANDSAGFATASACTTSADRNDRTGNYNLGIAVPACAFLFAYVY